MDPKSGPSPDKAKLGPPPRWHKCPRKGLIIANKFIPLKTPLCDLYDSFVPEMYRFYPKMVFDSMQSQYEKIGLWIDLTNTDRFYNKDDVEINEAHYTKFNCRGHGECPSANQTAAFIEICRQFIADHPKQLIGVHCTHGFNRTGFLICAYLVQEKNWSIEAAVHAFSACRPPGIYKQDYIEELFNRYGDLEDAPPAPPLPDWCDESEPILNDDESEAGSIPSTSSNNVDSQFMDGEIPSVQPVPLGPRRAQIQNKCRDMCDYKKHGFPGSQPVSMEVENVPLLAQKPYKVSWKADGVRYMIMIEGKDEVYAFDRDHNAFQIPSLHFPHRKEDRNIKETLLDGEMIMDTVHGQKIFRYLIYDIVKFEGQPVGKCDFGRRLLCIQKEIVEPRNRAMESGALDRRSQTFGIRAKEFWPIELVEKILGEKFQSNLSHEIDGLVFQPVPDPYECGRCQSVLKWKPHYLNSIDFKLEIVKEQKGLGTIPEWKGYLYVMGLEHPFDKIHKVTKELKQYDKKIIECSFDPQKGWVFMRERTDKSFPNAFATAQGVKNSLKNPVTKEDLIKYINMLTQQREKEKQEQQKKRKGHPVENGGPVPPKIPRPESNSMPAPVYTPPKK